MCSPKSKVTVGFIKMEYVFKWAPEYKKAIFPVPIVEHTFARERILAAFKKALA